MAHLVDTSVLIRTTDRQDSRHQIAVDAMDQLRDRGERLVVAPQNIVEFSAVATRPRSARGLGLTPGTTNMAVSTIMKAFEVLPDGPAVFDEWLRLVNQCGVSGKQVHDARIAACMRTHQVKHILTFNGQDFHRFPDVTPVEP